MPQYLLKLSLALAVVYLFYWVLLRRLTFYNWNRWFLLLYPAACFLIPFVDVEAMLQRHGLQDAAMVGYIPVIMVTSSATSPDRPAIGWETVTGWLMAAGSIFMLVRLMVQYFSLKRLLASAELLSDGLVKLFHINKKIIPFSTRNAIYINRHLHAENELREIIRHEFIHIKQRHSLDLWWTEVLCILSWFNPFAWLIRKAIRQNLEYIADHQVLQSGFDRKQYQLLLLKVTGVAPFSFTSNFNFSSLKKRIVMMNKHKTAQVHLVRFLFILPLLAVVLLAFRSVTFKQGYAAIAATDTIPSNSNRVEDAFKAKGIKQIIIKEKGKKAQVTLDNGTIKTYDLSKPDEQAAFDKEYGELAPPPPPAAPRPVKPGVIPAPPAPPVPVTGAAVPAPPAPAKVSNTPTPPTPPGTPAPVVVRDIAIAPVHGVMEVTNLKIAPATLKADNIQGRVTIQDVAVTGQAKVEEQSGRVSQLINKVLEARKADGHAAVQPQEVKEVRITGQGSAKTQTTGIAIVADMAEVRNILPKAENVVLSGTVIEMRPDATSRTAFGAPGSLPLAEIKNTSTREELDEIIQALNKKGYSLEWKNMQFKDGLLVSLDGMIGYGNSKEAFSVDSFSAIAIYTYVNHPEKYFIKVLNGRVSFQQVLNY